MKRATVSVLTTSIILIMVLESAYPVLHASPTVNALLSDNFTQDTGLNTAVWQTNGPTGTTVGQFLGPSPIMNTIITPSLAFSTSSGMAVTGVSSTFQASTIQSLQSFSAPFTAQAVVSSPAAFGNPFLLLVSSSDGGTGVGIAGNLNPANNGGYGIWKEQANGPGSFWTGIGGGTAIVSAPSINTIYTLGIMVDQNGQATLNVTSHGNVLGTSTAQVGTGKLFLILAQYEGAPNPVGANEADWLSASVASTSTIHVVLPPGIVAYVPVTLGNNQPIPTSAPFQQKVVVNSASLASFEASNLQNIEFFYENGSLIPSWLESGNSNTATQTVYWLNLANGIAASSSITVFMGFATSTTNLFNGVTTGEAPDLSSTYGQFDNGANVFSFYDNFARTTLGPNWGNQGCNSFGRCGKFSVNNGIAMSASAGQWIDLQTLATYPFPLVSEVNVASFSGSLAVIVEETTSTSQPATSCTGSYDQGYKGGIEDSSPYEFLSVCGTGPEGLASSTLPHSIQTTLGVAWTATGKEYASESTSGWTGSATDSTFNIANYHIAIGAGTGTSGSFSSHWVRARAPEPNNSRPAASVGSTPTIIQTGLFARYWNNAIFPSTPPDLTTIDANISFATLFNYNWHPFGFGVFTVEWNGTINIATGGSYNFQLSSDDGSWLYIDGTLVINNGGGHPPRVVGGTIPLTQGPHSIFVQFFECCGGQSGVDLYWMPPGQTQFSFVPSNAFVTPQANNHNLTVKTVDSTGNAVPGASVLAQSLPAGSTASATTDNQGSTILNLSTGTYNVTGSAVGYLSNSWQVSLGADQNITLTLARPYHFLGTIPNADLIIQQSPTGYNISIFNLFSGSPAQIFFDWKSIGTVQPGSWASFSFNHLPNLIVEAAGLGTADYPNAWEATPLPPQLTPTSGMEGAFLQESVPYVAGSIFVTPYPPVLGQATTIGVTLHNPFNHTFTISRVEFDVGGLNVAGFFSSVGVVDNVVLDPLAVEPVSVIWIATISGHHCIRVVLTYAPGAQSVVTQALQRNIDIEAGILQGQTGRVGFQLANPTSGSAIMSIQTVQQLPSGWSTILDVNGMLVDTSKPLQIQLAAGASVGCTLTILSASGQSGIGSVDVQAYINGQLVGGVRKEMSTTATPIVTITGISPQDGPTSGGTSIAIDGMGFKSGNPVSVKFSSGSNAVTVACDGTTDCIIQSDSLLTLTTSPWTGQAGIVDVTVTAGSTASVPQCQSQPASGLPTCSQFVFLENQTCYSQDATFPLGHFKGKVPGTPTGIEISGSVDASLAGTDKFCLNLQNVSDPSTYSFEAQASLDTSISLHALLEASASLTPDPIPFLPPVFVGPVTIRPVIIVSANIKGSLDLTITHNSEFFYDLVYSVKTNSWTAAKPIFKCIPNADGVTGKLDTLCFSESFKICVEGQLVLGVGFRLGIDIPLLLGAGVTPYAFAQLDASLCSNNLQSPSVDWTLTAGVAVKAKGRIAPFGVKIADFKLDPDFVIIQKVLETSGQGTGTISSGSATVDLKLSNGVKVQVSGSKAPDGTTVTVTSTRLSAQAAGPPAPLDVLYYNVTIQGITDGEAEICVTDPAVTPQIIVEYWDGTSWTNISLGPASGGTVCGLGLVSILSSAPLAIGIPAFPPLVVSQYFTDANGNNLVSDPSGFPSVTVVMSNGIKSTNPGQVLAWTRVSDLVDNLGSIVVNETLPVDWVVHPAWVPSHGAIHVYFVLANGTRIEITQPASITVSTGNPEVVKASITNMTGTLAGSTLQPGESILLSVQLSYRLIGTKQDFTSFPRSYADSARVSAWANASMTGTLSSATSSTAFLAYSKVNGDVDGDGVVNIQDASMIAYAFGARPGDARWNPALDVLNQGVINLQDVSYVYLNYGNHA